MKKTPKKSPEIIKRKKEILSGLIKYCGNNQSKLATQLETAPCHISILLSDDTRDIPLPMAQIINKKFKLPLHYIRPDIYDK